MGVHLAIVNRSQTPLDAGGVGLINLHNCSYWLFVPRVRCTAFDCVEQERMASSRRLMRSLPPSGFVFCYQLCETPVATAAHPRPAAPHGWQPARRDSAPSVRGRRGPRLHNVCSGPPKLSTHTPWPLRSAALAGGLPRPQEDWANPGMGSLCSLRSRGGFV